MNDEKETAAFYEIFNNLMSGKVYGEELTDVRFPCFWSVLWLGHERNGAPIFFWRNYGQSANSANRDGLTFILMKIFEMRPTEFLARFTIEE